MIQATRLITVIVSPPNCLLLAVSQGSLMFLALLGLMDARIGGADVLKFIVWLSFCRALAAALTAKAWGGPRYGRLKGVFA